MDCTRVKKYCIPKEVVQDKNKEAHASKDGGSGSLLRTVLRRLWTSRMIWTSSNVFFWCQYPPSISDVEDVPVAMSMAKGLEAGTLGSARARLGPFRNVRSRAAPAARRAALVGRWCTRRQRFSSTHAIVQRIDRLCRN